jgi:hypothetical protein
VLLPTEEPTSPALNDMNTTYQVNQFVNAITDNGGALYSVYSIDKRPETRTVKWYDVESDPSVAPL